MQACKPSVSKVANIEDEASCEAYEIFRFRTVGGDIRYLRLARGRSRDPHYVYRELLRANAALPGAEFEALALVRQATETAEVKQMLHAGALGWRPGGDGFVLWDTCIGLSGRVLPPMSAEKSARARLTHAGTLKAWQRRVAKPACCSSRLMLVIAAAFAAPLLRFASLKNFGVNLFGLSTEGRDLAAAVAGSVIGRDPIRVLPDWWVAPESLLRQAADHADLLFCAGGQPPSGRGAGPSIQQIRLQRLRSGDTSNPSSTPRWRGLFLSLLPDPNPRHPVVDTRERFSDDRICLELPADGGILRLTGPEPSGIAHPSSDGPGGSRRLRMRRGAAKHYGWPLRVFLRYLIRHRTTLDGTLRKHLAAFRGGLRDRGSGATPFEADCFALLYAGGCLAIASGVLPWRRAQLEDALLVCLDDLIRHRRQNQLTGNQVRHVLLKRLVPPAVVRRNASDRFGPHQHAGFYQIADGRRTYTVHAAQFRRWFGGPGRGRAAVAWLHRRGLLDVGGRQVTPSLDTIRWAERTPRWPDGSVQKSVVFRLPKPRIGPSKSSKLEIR